MSIGFLMVIHDFHLFGVALVPNKTDAVFVVDADAMLPFAITRQRFQPIGWRDS